MVFEFRSFESDLQNENLINEFKGNLFEFQVAQRVAQKANCQSDFISNVPPQVNIQLRSYQSYLIKHRPSLLKEIDLNSQTVLDALNKYFPDLDEIVSVELVGKVLGRTNTEADIFLKWKDRQVPLSLKYTKKHAWLNTKSGGIKSFYHYFNHPDSKARQSNLTRKTEIEFEKLAQKLHERNSIEYDGNFDKWRDLGLTELPGQLGPGDRELLLNYYRANCSQIFDDLRYFYSSSVVDFQSGLWSLLGFQDLSVLQVICFVGKDRSEIKIYDSKNLEEFDVIEFINTESKTSFEIKGKGFRLQIRVKPMNKFTVAGLKVNCSVKHLVG